MFHPMRGEWTQHPDGWDIYGYGEDAYARYDLTEAIKNAANQYGIVNSFEHVCANSHILQAIKRFTGKTYETIRDFEHAPGREWWEVERVVEEAIRLAAPANTKVSHARQ
jgi:hypothetical protein